MTTALGEFPSEDANTSESGAATRRRARGQQSERVEVVACRSFEIALGHEQTISLGGQ